MYTNLQELPEYLDNSKTFNSFVIILAVNFQYKFFAPSLRVKDTNTSGVNNLYHLNHLVI